MRIPNCFSHLTNAVLVVCAVTVTTLVVRQHLFPASPLRRQAAMGTEVVTNWRRYAAVGHREGPAAAPVDIVVFSDYQCPACRTLAGYLHAVRAEFPEQVAVVIRHAPLPIHAHAVEAARASECAARQGRFSAYHDALFQAQPSIGLVPWTRFASTAGVADVPAFDRCMAERGPAGSLGRDTLAARELRLQGTPTFLVNGTLVRGTPPLDTLRAYVQRALARAGAPPAAGTPAETGTS